MILNYHPNTVKDLFSKANIRRDSILLFRNLSDLVGYIIDLPTPQLKIFFQYAKQDLSAFFIIKVEDLCEIAQYFDAERFTIIACEMAGYRLKTIQDFLKLSESIDLPVFRMICAHLKEQILKQLTLEHFILACKTLKDSPKIEYWLEIFLEPMLKRPLDIKTFCQLKPFINEGQYQELFKQYRQKFIEETLSIEEFLNLYTVLDTEEQEWYLKKIIFHHLDQIIDSTSDLTTLICELEEDIFEKYSKTLASFMTTMDLSLEEYAKILSGVPVEYRSTIVENNTKALFSLLVKSENHECMEPYKSVMLKHFVFKDIYNQLKQECYAQYSFEFLSSFILNDSQSIPAHFQKLFTPNHQQGFFKQVAQPLPILNIILSMPKPYIKTLFHALELKYPKKSQQQQHDVLSKYLKDIFDSKPQIKRFKAQSFA